MTSIEDGSVKLRIEPEVIEDVIDESLSHVSKNKDNHKIKVNLITHNQQVNPIIEIIFYINANKIESVISYFDNCLWNMGIQKNI